MKTRLSWSLSLLLAAAVLMLAPPTSATSGPTGHYQIPSAVPSTISPAVNDGQVQAIVQVGNTVVIGGTFTNLTPKGGSATKRTQIASLRRGHRRAARLQPRAQRRSG